MDTIYIRDLRIETVIGVHAWEQRIRQTLRLDLELETDIRPAAHSDDIADTLDYVMISERVRTLLDQHQFQLMEALAEHIANTLLHEFAISRLRLSLSKPGALSSAREVGIQIERSRIPL
ncbi:dihydroneopterin aldolase [Thiorhodospira sibirica]|uniref:dihydroneopterin aldolase n=1 Tax=Thiorhodospira sibirica TaxID=154347 RepID=UPI00022C4686|nr:dihydroneopterin aldolase [Thiorhodospira sibirica]